MKNGGWYGNDRVDYFNGGLFDEAPPLPLNAGEIPILAKAATRHWSGRRAEHLRHALRAHPRPEQAGADRRHYTSKADILLVIEPVIMTPLRRKWAAVQEADRAATSRKSRRRDQIARSATSSPPRSASRSTSFRRYLGRQRILDPACGSGNFLYVALQQLLDLDDEIVRFVKRVRHRPEPASLHPPDAVARHRDQPATRPSWPRSSIWIGYLQWIAEHNVTNDKRPILDKLVTIENRDAILDLSKPNLPVSAKWPEADFIVGNPPFLGSKVFRDNGLSNNYVVAMFRGPSICQRPPTFAVTGLSSSGARLKEARNPAGLLSHSRNSWRRRTARSCRRIKETGDIFMAWSDRELAFSTVRPSTFRSSSLTGAARKPESVG